MLLARADREDRALGAEVGAVAAGLDLDEDQGAAVDGRRCRARRAGCGRCARRSPSRPPPAGRRPGPRPGARFSGARRSSPADPRARMARWRAGRVFRAESRSYRRCTACAPRARFGSVASAPVLATARTFTLDGISARPVRVEVDVHRGLPAFSVVGLPDAAVREARERVRAALTNCGFEFPLRRIVANLAPASLRKAGPGLDLAIAAALLTASGQLELGGAATGGDGRRARPRRLGPRGPRRAGDRRGRSRGRART